MVGDSLKKVLWILVFCLGVSSCAKKKLTDDLSSQGDAIPEEDKTKTIEANILSLFIEGKYEEGGNPDQKTYNFGTCVVPPDTTKGSTTTCEIAIKEAQLHYTTLTFKYGGGGSSVCPLLYFYPYYYIKSTAASFDPFFGSTDASLDCSEATNGTNVLEWPEECLGGSLNLITGAERSLAYYSFLDTSTQMVSMQFMSPHVKNKDASGKIYDYRTNLSLTNNLVTRSSDIVVSSKKLYYSADSFNDYTWTCNDLWGNVLYTLKLILSDEDEKDDNSETSKDTYYDWGG